MLRNTCGLILADDKRIQLGELSKPRALSAMPFGGRYRIIDFALSNMVNSGIRSVGVSTFEKYKSLMDHLGTGSAWDLDRKNNGLSLIPPYVSAEHYGDTSDDLTGILDYYRDLSEKYIVVMGSNVILNTTFLDMAAAHLEKQADITVAYNRDGDKGGHPNYILDISRSERIKGVYQNPLNPISNRSSLGILYMERQLFIDTISELISRGIGQVSMDYFIKLHDRYKVFGYEMKEKSLRINSTTTYFQETMRSLDEPVRSSIFWPETPVFTKVKDEAPAMYAEGSSVKASLVSDGCLIEGEVHHSLLFRGVTVGSHSKVKHSIIFQDTFIAEGCELENVIIDKDCIIRPGTKLIGQAAYPIVIGKGSVV